MPMSSKIKSFVENTVKELVDSPDEVGVNVSVSTKAIIVQIDATKQDLGKIIGKKGRTIDALKVVTLAIKNTHFPKDARKISLEVLEDEESSFSYPE